MQEFFASETSWLTLTNVALGVVTIACVAAVARTAFMELAERARAKANVRAWQDDHSFVLSELGVTMADGGEPIDEWEPRPKSQQGSATSPDDAAAPTK